MVQGGESFYRVLKKGQAVLFEFAFQHSAPSNPWIQFRGALNVAALSAFLTYVGAGLDGQAGLGDFNLQLNDSYQGQVVKGCPAYDDVRQPSMDGFDLEKYQGKWYEQKFHDWTQFKEVYDTTLDIKLTSDKKVRMNCIGSSVICIICLPGDLPVLF